MVIKSMSPVGIAAVESLQGHSVSSGSYAAMVLIVVANVVSVYYDLEYHPLGYMWAFANVGFNITYITMLRQLKFEASNVEKTLHNNFLLVMVTAPVAVISGELPAFFFDFAATSPQFKIMYSISCLLAAAIGTTVFWVIQATSGSTLSFVGSSNKILVVILGTILFKAKISRPGMCGIGLGILASILFTISKAQSMPEVAKPLETVESSDAAKGSRSPRASEDEDEEDLSIDDKAVHLRRTGPATAVRGANPDHV